MRRTPRRIWPCVALAAAVAWGSVSMAAGAPRLRRGKLPHDLAEVLSRMDDAAKHLKTLSAKLQYTKVTILVNDKSTEVGRVFFHKSKSPQLLIEIEKPDAKAILIRKNKAEIYYPKMNQIQEYEFEQSSELVQHFLSLGFGTETGNLKKDWKLKYLGEEELEGETTAILELTPRKDSVAARLAKVQLWVSEESWLPFQQKFEEPGGDYVLARYSAVKVNRQLPGSTFRLSAPKDAKRVKMH